MPLQIFLVAFNFELGRYSIWNAIEYLCIYVATSFYEVVFPVSYFEACDFLVAAYDVTLFSLSLLCNRLGLKKLKSHENRP